MAHYREKCLREKGEECHICGADDNRDALAVHHIDGDRANNDLENLVPLCYSCHLSIHNGAEGYEDWRERLLDVEDRDRSKTMVQVSGEVHTLLKEHRHKEGFRSLNDALHDILRDAGYDVREPVTPPHAMVDLGELLKTEVKEAAPEPLTAPDLADQFGHGRETISDHLWELEEAGEVETKKVGARARIWWWPEVPVRV